MNIKELQLEKAKQAAILASIKSGRNPILSQINAFIKSKFKFAPAGSPSFRPPVGKKYDCSNKAEFNKALEQIHSDLTDLYDADNFINNEILSTCNFYTSRKERLTGQLNYILNELDNIMTVIENPEISSDISDVFKNFNKVDFVGVATRNIPKTNAYIDLPSRCIANDTVFTNKVNLRDCEITCAIKTSNTGVEKLSDIKNCVSDNANETWIQRVTTSSNECLEYTVDIALKEESVVNTVSYMASSARKQSITLYLLDADDNIFIQNTITTTEKAEWNFKNIKIKALKFEVKKQECDATNGVDYDYYIGAKNIGLYNNTYEEKSVFVSNGEKIERAFSKVVFSAKENIPPSTNVTYYVGIDNHKDAVSWMQIDNKQITELNLLPEKRIVIEPGESDRLLIATLPENYVERTTVVHTGVDMWQVRSKAFTQELLPKDIFTQPISKFEEMNYIKYSIDSRIASIYTAYAEYELPTVVTGKFAGHNLTHAIYVNGSKLIGQEVDGVTTYTLRMAKGVNQIQILVTNATDSKQSFKFDAYLQEFATMVKAIKETKEISYYDLVENLHIDTFDCFACENGLVVANYMMNTYNIRYVIDYRCNDKPDLFKNADLRVMMVLTSKNENVTPKVFSYQAAIL